MKKLDLLRKLIREEVARAIKEEMPKIIKEAYSQSGDYKKNIQEQMKKSSSVPLTLNEQAPKPIKFDNASPLGKLLNETAISMTSDDAFSFGSKQNTGGIVGLQNHENAGIGSVSDMLANAKKSSHSEMVQIDTVPDFTGMMDKLKSKGLL